MHSLSAALSNRFTIFSKFGIPISNLTTSWKDGMAFLGLVKVFEVTLVNLYDFRNVSSILRLETAFRLAKDRFDIPRLLEISGKKSRSYIFSRGKQYIIFQIFKLIIPTKEAS